MPEFRIEIAGKSQAAYDRYPNSWPQGSTGQNLETFAWDLLDQGVVGRSDLLVVGSRGGQVVLPWLWRALDNRTPPAVVINGGCAMKLPAAICWPRGAISFLLMGGLDNFRGAMSKEAYVADAKSRVPAENRTTAILFVNEMTHMPQSDLLRAVLPFMLKVLLAWKEMGPAQPPLREFDALLSSLARTACWSGRLLYTQSAGVWQETAFGSGTSVPAKREQLSVSSVRRCVQ